MFTKKVAKCRKPARKFSGIESLEDRVLLTSMGADLIEADAGDEPAEVLIISDFDGMEATSDGEALYLLEEPTLTQQVESEPADLTMEAEATVEDVYVDEFAMDYLLWESELAIAETYPTVDYVYVDEFAMDSLLWETELVAAEGDIITTYETIDSSTDGETLILLEEPVVSQQIESEPVDLTLESDPQIGMASYGSIDPYVDDFYSDADSFESMESDLTNDDVFVDQFALDYLLAGI